MTELGMPRSLAAELAEVLDIVERQRVTAEMQHRIKQGRGMAAREDEAIAPGPLRVGRIEAHVLSEQQIGNRGRLHRRSGVSGIGLLHSIGGEQPNGVD